MTVTPQTNATLEQIAEAIRQGGTFMVCGHVNPDGDCIGSCAALYLYIRKNFPEISADLFLEGEEFQIGAAGDEIGSCSRTLSSSRSGTVSDFVVEQYASTRSITAWKYSSASCGLKSRSACR